MVNASDPTDLQSGFFEDSGELSSSHPQFAEICTALYERELLDLALNSPNNISIVRRKIGGLPYHVRSVARFLLDNSTPLAIDAHNGSWFAKQAAQCPNTNNTPDLLFSWLSKHADYGLVLPVLVESLEGKHIELDAIDKISLPNEGVHLNKHGWFDFRGGQITPDTNKHVTKTLLKPSKANLTAACCGHTWRHRGKGINRSLQLREMRLSTKINWKGFTLQAKNE